MDKREPDRLYPMAGKTRQQESRLKVKAMVPAKEQSREQLHALHVFFYR